MGHRRVGFLGVFLGPAKGEHELPELLGGELLAAAPVQEAREVLHLLLQRVSLGAKRRALRAKRRTLRDEVNDLFEDPATLGIIPKHLLELRDDGRHVRRLCRRVRIRTRFAPPRFLRGRLRHRQRMTS